MKSANDACVALAEQMAGSEQVFVQNMNLQACLLGCADTNFCNSMAYRLKIIIPPLTIWR